MPKKKVTKKKVAQAPSLKSSSNKIFEQNVKEAAEELRKPEPSGIKRGFVGIIIGLIGLIVPYPFMVITGIFAIALGAFANKHGQRTLGMISGALGIIELAMFLPWSFLW